MTWLAPKSFRCFLGPNTTIEAGFVTSKAVYTGGEKIQELVLVLAENFVLYECDLSSKEQQLLTFSAAEMVELTLS